MLSLGMSVQEYNLEMASTMETRLSLSRTLDKIVTKEKAVLSHGVFVVLLAKVSSLDSSLFDSHATHD